ncbi:MAG: hypothetical protein ACTSRP_19770 [Candidatus Helarchaeota archaeon]
MATGYITHKVLGVKMSYSRKERNMQEMLDEAEKKPSVPYNYRYFGCLDNTIAIIKNLKREISHVIHKHKKNIL